MKKSETMQQQKPATLLKMASFTWLLFKDSVLFNLGIVSYLEPATNSSTKFVF